MDKRNPSTPEQFQAWLNRVALARQAHVDATTGERDDSLVRMNADLFLMLEYFAAIYEWVGGEVTYDAFKHRLAQRLESLQSSRPSENLGIAENRMSMIAGIYHQRIGMPDGGTNKSMARAFEMLSLYETEDLKAVETIMRGHTRLRRKLRGADLVYFDKESFTFRRAGILDDLDSLPTKRGRPKAQS